MQQGFDVIFKDSRCLLRSVFDTTSSEEMEGEDGEKGSETNDKTEVVTVSVCVIFRFNRKRVISQNFISD